MSKFGNTKSKLPLEHLEFTFLTRSQVTACSQLMIGLKKTQPEATEAQLHCYITKTSP